MVPENPKKSREKKNTKMKAKLALIISIIFFIQSCVTYKLTPDIQGNINFGGLDAKVMIIPDYLTGSKPRTKTLSGLVILASITGVIVTANYVYLLGVLGSALFPAIANANANKKIPTEDKHITKWLKKYNNDRSENLKLYNLKGNQYVLLPDNASSLFAASNFDEVIFYANNLFNSESINGFISRSSSTLDKKGLEQLIKLYPTNIEIARAKKQYVDKAENINTLVSSNSKYNSYTKDELMYRAAQMVTNNSEFADYRLNFGRKTSHDDFIIAKVLNKKLQIYEIHQLIELYPNTSKLSDLVNQGVLLSNSFDELIKFTKYGDKFKQDIANKAENIVKGDPLSYFRNFIINFSFSKHLRRISDGEYFLGYLNMDGLPNGNGILIKMRDLGNPNEDNFYIGNFESGKLNGSDCKILLRNGNYLDYKGSVKDNLPNGQGVGKGNMIKNNYRLAYIEDNKNSISYNGNWLNGSFQGEGVIEGNVTKLFGVYDQGRLNGECTIYWVKRSNKTGGFLGALLSYADNYAGATGMWRDDSPYGTHVVKVQTGSSAKKEINVSSYSELLSCARNLLSSVRADNQRFDNEKKQQECNDCIINESESTFPTEATDFFGFTYDKPGLIRMKNDEEYEFYYQNGEKPWYIITSRGIFSDDTKSFKSFYELSSELVRMCKEKRCR